jgi:hypothetical protein
MRHRSSLILLVATFVAGLLPARAYGDDTRPPPAAPAPTPKPDSKPAPLVVEVPVFMNGTCPIMGKPASRALFADTDFGRVYVCCPPCVKKILADPARASSAAYPTVRKAGNTVDPITGAAIGDGAVTITLQGYEIALASDDSVAPARANAQVTLVKALHPDVVDLRNGTDPIDGLAVVPNAFVLIDRQLVRLSSPANVDKVRLDPAKALQRAKEIRAAEDAAREKPKDSGPAK